MHGKGYYIMLTGSKKHPENIATISFCGNNYFVIENEEDVDEAINSFKKSGINKLLLISQTTYSLEGFYNIQKEIENAIPKNVQIIVKNTICSATKIRQNETEKIAKDVDAMVIIGGKNSSNTKKLFNIAKDFCKNSICIENDKELDLQRLSGSNKVGIMAGASTPKESIEKVIELIEEYSKNLVHMA